MHEFVAWMEHNVSRLKVCTDVRSVFSTVTYTSYVGAVLWNADDSCSDQDCDGLVRAITALICSPQNRVTFHLTDSCLWLSLTEDKCFPNRRAPFLLFAGSHSFLFDHLTYPSPHPCCPHSRRSSSKSSRGACTAYPSMCVCALSIVLHCTVFSCTVLTSCGADRSGTQSVS